MTRCDLLLGALGLAGLTAAAQAPLLQDGAAALRQARLDWVQGQTLLPPSSLPFLEVGLGGAGSEGTYTPLVDSEGLGHGTAGWGLGLQGRYARGGFSVAATALVLRDRDHTAGILQRAAIAYQTEAGWRVALEQAPFAWGTGLNGGDLLSDSARAFPRLSLATPDTPFLSGRWRGEAFAGRVEGDRPLPDWLPARDRVIRAQAAGLDLQRPFLWGGLLRSSFGLVEGTVGAISLTGGRDDRGQAAPAAATRTESLAELRVRLPALARFAQARGASAYVSRSGAPDGPALALVPARDLGGLQLAWDGWDLGLEYAGAAPPAAPPATARPAYLEGFSSHGDPLGSAFGRAAITRTAELGLPWFLEGQGRLKVVRATAALDQPSGTGSWFLQGEAQWRTSTGRLGASLASRRDEFAGARVRWGWACSLFQAFRVF